MSVKVMTAVFERYPNGGGEMILALALADWADDEGNKIFPAVATLAKKTRQAPRTVQYQLRRMQEMGWLKLVKNAGGGRNRAREYAINSEWIKGAELAPFMNPEKGATAAASFEGEKGADSAPFNEGESAQDLHPSGEKGCNSEQERVQTTTQKGATAIAPDPSGTIKEPSEDKNITDLTGPKMVIDHLNNLTGAKYQLSKANVSGINARLTEGFTVDDCLAVVNFKVAEWGPDIHMRQYLRPETLFRPGKFPGYLAAAKSSPIERPSFSDMDYHEGVTADGSFS